MVDRALFACLFALGCSALASGCAGTGLSKGERGEKGAASEGQILKSEEEAIKREEIAELNQMREEIGAIEGEKREIQSLSRAKHREQASKESASRREKQATEKIRGLEETLSTREHPTSGRGKQQQGSGHKPANKPSGTGSAPETSSEAVPNQ